MKDPVPSVSDSPAADEMESAYDHIQELEWSFAQLPILHAAEETGLLGLLATEDQVTAADAAGALSLHPAVTVKVLRALRLPQPDGLCPMLVRGHYAAGTADGSIRLWDVDRDIEEQLVVDHGAGINTIRFSPDGSRLASGGVDGKIVLWDQAPALTPALTIAAGKWVSWISFSSVMGFSPRGSRAWKLNESAA